MSSKMTISAAILVGLAGLPKPSQAVRNGVVAPDGPLMRLDEIGLYEVGYTLKDGKWRQFPAGWSGYFDELVGVACTPHGKHQDRSAFLLHPPWRQGGGAVYQQFTIRLPWAKNITLRGATAMRPDCVGKSDGVIFRVYVNGVKKHETLRKADAWQAFQIDLTPLRSKTVVIRFETDSGARYDGGWDFSLWSGREIVLTGFRPKTSTRPDPARLDLAPMHSTPNGSVAPPGGFRGSRTVALDRDTAALRYSGPDGTLEYGWRRPTGTGDGVFGELTLHAKMRGDKEAVVPLATSARVEWTGPARLVRSRWERVGDGAACASEYSVAGHTVVLMVTARLMGKSLVLDVTCDSPVARALDPGAWGPVARRRMIPTPYCSVQVSYMRDEGLFTSCFLDWTTSNASRHDGNIARYGPLTDSTLNLLRDRVVYTAAWHLAEVLPNIPNAPSPHIGQVGGKMVLDIWGGRYTEIAKHLETLHSYGVRECIALVHVWQRSGYDNALPTHLPANKDLGGDDGMKSLVETCRRLGYLVALHENYVDYYPNYDHFDEKDIALNSASERVNAWFNPGTKIQSFAVKPNGILPLARTQSPEIHTRFGTNACYLDVHSAVPPGFHVDFRAGEEGAGMLTREWDVHRELWDYERKTHGGPVFGEGNAHWYWSGALDGVEAQFGTGWPALEGESAPLAIDFDLLRIHPLQINHGMGYYERWSQRSGWGAFPPMAALDQYRMQEAIYGHAPFLGAPNWSHVGHAWLEHHLLTPVSARHSRAKPSEITYHVNGRWVDSSTAAKSGDWRRPRVRYDNGLTIVANDSSESLDLGGVVLPRFGWMAKGAGVFAYTGLKDGSVVDYAETEDSVFANARDAFYWNAGSIRRIRPAVGSFEQTGPREFRTVYLWFADEELEKDFRCFVHFVAASEGSSEPAIRFQNDHALERPTSIWTAGETVRDGPHTVSIPDDVADGDYVWAVGLFTPDGPRLPLLGVQDNEARIRVGILRVRDQGKSIAFDPEPRPGDERLKLYSQHLNDGREVVDFGVVKTSGSVLIRKEDRDWVLRTLPRDKPFQILLSAKRFGSPTEVRCVAGSAETLSPAASSGWWRLEMNGATEYRWEAD